VTAPVSTRGVHAESEGHHVNAFEAEARLGPREDVAQGVFRLARRAAKAAASRPDLEDLFRAALAELEGRAASEAGRWVQTHGRYYLGHVSSRPRA
jgi:hypothetical protein